MGWGRLQCGDANTIYCKFSKRTELKIHYKGKSCIKGDACDYDEKSENCLEAYWKACCW